MHSKRPLQKKPAFNVPLFLNIRGWCEKRGLCDNKKKAIYRNFYTNLYLVSLSLVKKIKQKKNK